MGYKLENHNFAAIDFETANTYRDSACAVSVVIVKDNKIDQQMTYLIKPPYMHFTFTHIHNLSWSDVEMCQTFKSVWEEISGLLTDIQFIAAHNATFDRSVLYSCCERDSIAPPKLPFVCTVHLARSVWKIFPTNLPSVCKHLKIPLKHHDPSSDAAACAKIVLSAIKTGAEMKAYCKKGC